ncbi:class I SAM-dependent methyltransferase [Dechloromonas denitrificans]|uniref:class I SAM-dependent methyltransferase n=1 Tax=Dechloromonas denitrificans TaxID=281362 RepID=UPI001CFC085D|nr:class I SAM-dependent methyltransferase [Dechloromonas denitrificans]UCV06659.1 class I SAM-dependent methyltransferase [Dechloromonas denitrificans]
MNQLKSDTVDVPERENCLTCGNAGPKSGEAYMLTDRRMGLAGEWRLVRCTACSVISMDPMATDEQLADYYAGYAGDAPLDFSLKAGSRRPWLRKLFHRLSGDVDPRDFIDAPMGARMLDYGCGNVGYLADFHARGFDISGAELSARVVEQCRRNGFDVRQVLSFSDIPFGSATFDVVYLMQVFEHLRDPNLFFGELFRIMRPDGTLYLAVPNADSIWRRVFGRNWVSGWFAPFHLFHYNSTGLASLARKHGFELVDTWSDTPESWFRLNLQAWLQPAENRLDSKQNWLASLPVRLVLMCLLRLVELPVSNRDCLVVKFKKMVGVEFPFTPSTGLRTLE